MLASWLPSMFDSFTLILFALAGVTELLIVHRLSRPAMIALAIVVSVLASAIAAVIRHAVDRSCRARRRDVAQHQTRRMDPAGLLLAARAHLRSALPALRVSCRLPLLLGRASFLPGGIAVTEVAMAALFGGLGVPPSIAVVAVLTYRLISFWMPALAGIPISITLQSRRAR